MPVGAGRSFECSTWDPGALPLFAGLWRAAMEVRYVACANARGGMPPRVMGKNGRLARGSVLRCRCVRTTRQAPGRVFAPGEPSIRLRRQARAAQSSALAAWPSSPSHDRQHPTVRLRSESEGTNPIRYRPSARKRQGDAATFAQRSPGLVRGWRLTRRPSAHLLRGGTSIRARPTGRLRGSSRPNPSSPAMRLPLVLAKEG